MKTYLMIPILCCFFFTSKGQRSKDTCETVILKGFMVKQFKRTEIAELNKTTSRTQIDFFERSYFLPIKSDVSDRNMLDKINHFNPNEVYFLPSEQTNELIKKYCQNNGVLSTDKSSGHVSRPNFFQVDKGDVDFVYRIYYMECKALKSIIVNNSFNAFRLNVPYDKKNKSLTCYFIYQNLILGEIEKINYEGFSKIDYIEQ